MARPSWLSASLSGAPSTRLAGGVGGAGHGPTIYPRTRELLPPLFPPLPRCATWTPTELPRHAAWTLAELYRHTARGPTVAGQNVRGPSCAGIASHPDTEAAAWKIWALPTQTCERVDARTRGCESG